MLSFFFFWKNISIDSMINLRDTTSKFFSVIMFVITHNIYNISYVLCRNVYNLSALHISSTSDPLVITNKLKAK